MKNLLFVTIIILFGSCQKEEYGETQKQTGKVQDFLTEEVQEFIAEYATISINRCNGQINLLFMESYPGGGGFQWGMNFNQAEEVHPCITWYTNNPYNEPLIIPFIIDKEIAPAYTGVIE